MRIAIVNHAVMAREALQNESLVCIGSSAGGPTALARLLTALPADFPGAVVIVQHVDAQFAQGLADWLGSQTRLPVRVAHEGETLQPGVVLLAGRDHHLVLLGPRRLGYVRAAAEILALDKIAPRLVNVLMSTA